MPRKPLITPARKLNTCLDGNLGKELDALLWSEAEGRIPAGAHQRFLSEAIVRMLRQVPLDLSPFAGSIPSEHVVYGFPATIELLTHLLRGKQ